MAGGVQAAVAAQQRLPADEPLLDWTPWRQYRGTVAHPASVIKRADLERAAENQRRHEWARRYVADVERGAQAYLARINPDWLVGMLPTDTPGDVLFTPCPACRDQGKPAHPHGQWQWSADRPDGITCQVCATAFPNERYPEELVFRTRTGQTISFYGGAPFTLFGYQGRPSFTASIRARKVGYATGACRQLAEAYALTGRVEYAQAVRQLLLRLAEVYPGWLVHVGYGEYADVDPHLAALNIDALPADEITSTPGGPDRKLHSGYWQGGRATGTGMEAGFVRSVVEAYSFVAEAMTGDQPLFSDTERLRIEKDLILESTVLLVADKSVNNKSVGNATAVALVGMVLGHPEMVRFGLRVFLQTVDGWFLADGGTSESYAYASMTLSGIEALGQAFRGYSDPPGYADAEGKRLDGLDLYRDTAYKRVWEAMFLGLQGDLRYPPLADSYVSTGLGAGFAELMAANYPQDLRYVALLRELTGKDLAGGDVRRAVYYRAPGLADSETPPLALPDHLFPVLRQGNLRSGPAGRDSLLVLDASHWGGHHHLDSLNLYYWQDGHELLSDLGYLWDHPQSAMTRRTLAHNTVMVDGADQATKDRGGEFALFAPAGSIKVMEADSRAYAQASLYRRTVVQIEHSPGHRYVLDLFRVQGGNLHDYVFHGPGNEVDVRTPQLAPLDPDPARPDLQDLRGATAEGPWRITWKLAEPQRFSAVWHNDPGFTSLIGKGWGQRDYRNADVGATIPYIVRRVAAGNGPTVFFSVFEGHAEGEALVTGLRRLAVPDSEQDQAVALAVDTVAGTDYLVSCMQARPLRLDTPDGPLEVAGRFAAVSLRHGEVAANALVEGTALRFRGQSLTGP
jgi:hypothetical protein